MHRNRQIIRTEHPKLLIFDESTDTLSSLLYVERHIGTQMDNLYVNIMRRKCEIERKTIQNFVALASLAPNEFVHTVMKKPGYLTRVVSEIVQLIRCQPREVKIAHLPYCFDQLPLTAQNETWFLTPKPHIFTKKARQIEAKKRRITQFPAIYRNQKDLYEYRLISNKWSLFTRIVEEITRESYVSY